MAVLLPRFVIIKRLLMFIAQEPPVQQKDWDLNPNLWFWRPPCCHLHHPSIFPAMPDMELTGIEPVSRISTHAEPLRRFCVCSPV